MEFGMFRGWLLRRIRGGGARRTPLLLTAAMAAHQFVPASWCGLVGLNPSRERRSKQPPLAEMVFATHAPSTWATLVVPV
ncbi:hypothetical protein ACVWXN_006794 [Bradyrhizobium sp. i1.4.4]